MRSQMDGPMRSHQHKNGGKGHPQRSTEELVQVLQAEVVWLRWVSRHAARDVESGCGAAPMPGRG
jgi:hypothetical protein